MAYPDGKCYLCRVGSALPGETCPKCNTVQPGGVTLEKQEPRSRSAFAAKVAFAAHYKAERDRCETCLGDILNLVSNDKNSDDVITQILDRMVSYYERS